MGYGALVAWAGGLSKGAEKEEAYRWARSTNRQ
jgi:hypothetical protein